MFFATRSNLLILGIVAQHMTSKTKCTAYTVARAHGISHVTARKELRMLDKAGFLVTQRFETKSGFGWTQYGVSKEGFHFLQDNLKAYIQEHTDFLFTGFDIW